MKKYERPELDVELFDVEDVITASGEPTTIPDAGEEPSTLESDDLP